MCENSGSEDDQFLSPLFRDRLNFETRVLVNPESLPCPRPQNVQIDLPVGELVGENVPTCRLSGEILEEPVEESLPESGKVGMSSDELELGSIDAGLDLCSKSVDELPAQETEMEAVCEGENKSRESPVPSEIMDAVGDQSEQVNDTEFEHGVIPRRSQRERQPAKRLEYPQLGNPLTVVIQSLLQGLSAAFSTSLEANVASADTAPVVLTQPQKFADAAGRA